MRILELFEDELGRISERIPRLVTKPVCLADCSSIPPCHNNLTAYLTANRWILAFVKNTY